MAAGRDRALTRPSDALGESFPVCGDPFLTWLPAHLAVASDVLGLE
jgi:hypothetical protein